jgi:hypothetical protein
MAVLLVVCRSGLLTQGDAVGLYSVGVASCACASGLCAESGTLCPTVHDAWAQDGKSEEHDIYM